MYKRTLLFLWAVAAAYGLSLCEGHAEPSHGSAHPHPKAHPPGKSGHAHAKSHTPSNTGGHANAKSFTPGNTAGHTSGTSQTGNKPQVLTFPHADHHKELAELKHKEHKEKEHAEKMRKEKELHERKVAEELARRARLEKEIAQLVHLLEEEKHHHHHHHWVNNGSNNPNSSQTSQQHPVALQQNGQQGSSGQSGSGSGSGGPGSNPAQVAQEESPGSESQGLVSNSVQSVEKLLVAALHQLEEAFSERGEHRHHRLAEARHLADEAVREIATVVQMMRTIEHPRMDVPHEHRRA
jgi:hypothetical protein